MAQDSPTAQDSPAGSSLQTSHADANASAERDQQAELMACLRLLLDEFSHYGAPRLRTDGDIVIPLDNNLKQNRAAYRGLANAFSEMMSSDIKPRRSQTWVD
ncbi:hypothetical protein OAP51_06160 [Alphaproteobacteria bacterium]|nr:hypothetical protein [Alphaproteobacteria bacterium]